MKKRVTLAGMVNYTGALCGVNFIGSVGEMDYQGTAREDRLLGRLKIMFPGTKIEDVPDESSPAQPSPPEDKKAAAPLPAVTVPEIKTEPEAEEEPAEPEEVEDDEDED